MRRAGAGARRALRSLPGFDSDDRQGREADEQGCAEEGRVEEAEEYGEEGEEGSAEEGEEGSENEADETLNRLRRRR